MLLVDVLLQFNIFPLQHLVQRRGALLDALFRISEGFYFRPHHLIMAVLLHFEKKVHKKKLQQANTIPLLFLRLLCHILEHMVYPIEPHLEHCHHCREHFTLDKWTQLSGYSEPVAAPLEADQAQQDDLLIGSVPPTPAPPMPKATPTVPPATPPIPPVSLPTSEASITISATEFRATVHLFQTLTTTYNALFR